MQRRYSCILATLLLLVPVCRGQDFNLHDGDIPYVVVLGIAQDAGVPQAGTKEHPAWTDPALRRTATCLAIVDPESHQRWLVEATPDFREQLFKLDMLAPVDAKPGLDGIFVTHAHIGHYTGLMYLGHESIGADDIPVYAMPRMRTFLNTNGPWDQLVRYRNINIQSLVAGESVRLNDRITMIPFLVPHRQEYSEVIGFKIKGPDKTILFIPDINKWEEWDAWGISVEDLIETVDVAYLDATFFADGEIPGRNMASFPHPFMVPSMERFDRLPASERMKIRFIHLNHTNPALYYGNEARKTVEERGYRIAEEMEIVFL